MRKVYLRGLLFDFFVFFLRLRFAISPLKSLTPLEFFSTTQNNPNAKEHFEEMKKQWSDRADTLTNLVDQGTDRVKFLEASGL